MRMSKPHDLAHKIYDKELELESNNSLPVLNSLVAYYKEAIEYYEDNKSPKYIEYQARLKKILIQPKVLQMIKKESSKDKTLPKRKQLKRVKTFNPRLPLEKCSLFLEEDSAEKESKVLNRLVENQEKRSENVSSKALENLRYQEQGLNERIENRKQKVSSFSLENSFNSCSSPKGSSLSLPQSPSGFFSRFVFVEDEENQSNKKIELLPNEVEKIIKENFEEKTAKITEIKLKYSKLEDLEEGTCNQRLVNLKKNMDDEIEEISKILDDKRRKMIAELKKI